MSTHAEISNAGDSNYIPSRTLLEIPKKTGEQVIGKSYKENDLKIRRYVTHYISIHL